MKVHEFRKNLKQAFDEALKGQAVLIERGGVQFKLVADVHTFREPGVGDITGIVVDKVERSKDLLMSKKDDLLKIDGLMVASEAECPRHHVAFRLCERRH